MCEGEARIRTVSWRFARRSRGHRFFFGQIPSRPVIWTLRGWQKYHLPRRLTLLCSRASFHNNSRPLANDIVSAIENVQIGTPLRRHGSFHAKYASRQRPLWREIQKLPRNDFQSIANTCRGARIKIHLRLIIDILSIATFPRPVESNRHVYILRDSATIRSIRN